MDIYCQALMSKRLTNRINKGVCGVRGGGKDEFGVVPKAKE